MPFGIGHWELIALAIVLVLLFGAKRIPELARTLGSGIREVRQSVTQADPRTELRRLEEPPAAKPSDPAGPAA